MAASALLLDSLSALPRCVLLCSGGLHNIIYSFGVGYGLNMLASGASVLLLNDGAAQTDDSAQTDASSTSATPQA